MPALFALALKSAQAAPELHGAMTAYERGSYLEAECMLLVAGHAGHPNAQELLGFMYAIGPSLYPGIWRSLMASKNWFERAAEGGRPAAQYMHAAFTRHGLLQVRADISASFDAVGDKARHESADGAALMAASAPRNSTPRGED
jgi:TPR repeat protein